MRREDSHSSFCVCVLQFEADRRAFIITINSFGTELSKEDRAKLFPHCGKLYPEGLAQLARADDYEQVKAVADFYPVSARLGFLLPLLRCGLFLWLAAVLLMITTALRSTSCSSRAPEATRATKRWRTVSLSMR